MTIRYCCFPRTLPPPHFVVSVVSIFQDHENLISTTNLHKGMTSDEVLGNLREDFKAIGFQVEGGKSRDQLLERPVYYGENGIPTFGYQIDAYHPVWNCGMEIEAGRAWMGNAVYRDLVQASVMVELDYLILAIPNAYKYKNNGRETISNDYTNTRNLADVLYGHTRLKLPYSLILIGY